MGWKVVTIIGAYGWQGSPGDLIRPKKKLRTVDGPLLHVVTTAYHLHLFLSLANLNIQKSLKLSNKRREKAQMSTHQPSSVRTQRASHRQQDRTELSFTSSWTWTNKYKLWFKHANRRIYERAQFSTCARCSVSTGRVQRDASQIAWTPNLPLLALVPTCTQLYQNTRLVESILEKTVSYVISEIK